MLSDPKALKYVLHTSGYQFPKSPDHVHLVAALIGPGVAVAEGMYCICLIIRENSTDISSDTVHQRQRKILNPAFSASQLRQSLPLFQSFTSKVRSTTCF